MRIAVDAMGGDYAPESTVLGSVIATKELGADIVLVGNKDSIEKVVKYHSLNYNRLEILHTEEIINVDDQPVQAIKKKKDSSMVRAIEMVKKREVEAVISAGNTGALMAGGLLKLGRLPGVTRPALAPIVPTMDGGFSVLLDVGANMDSDGANLYQFAIMGSIYCEKVLGKVNPRVGLLNVGTEKGKGNNITRDAYDILEKSSINFIGNLEARDLPFGLADVIVCDGFTGNILLKFMEGFAQGIFTTMKSKFTESTRSKIGAVLLKPALKSFKELFDYKEHGGAPFLGVDGVVIKAHGSSDGKAIKNAVRQGIRFVERDTLNIIETSLKQGLSE
jgi:glycerol-3-phosphate acyltransferase PlsX